ncbi:LptF/LptG family permease [Neosynechococcus sphagnicola]|nr:LptF/LptG family permease [Neosynechococcus sphagnicola]
MLKIFQLHLFRWPTFGLSVMDRYIAAELIMPFLFGVGMFSSIGVAVGALFELARRIAESGLPFTIALQVLALKLPEFVALALPMSTLLATLMVYSRLSSDSELIALRSCGVSVYRLVVPAVVMSFLVTGLTYGFYEVVVPAANYQASVTLERALKQDKPAFQEENILYQEFQEVTHPDGSHDDVLVRIFHAKKFDGQRMKGLTILDFSQDGLNQIIVAQTALWNFQQKRWDFFNGSIYLVAADGSYRNILRFAQHEVHIPRTPLDLAMRGRDYGEMNIAQSEAQLKLLRQGGDERKIRKLQVRIQQRYAFPFVCVVFGLVGASLGTRPQRTTRATGFGISVIVIFMYYMLYFLTNSLGLIGVLSPFLAGWLPVFAVLLAGSFLLVRAAR